MPSLEAEKLGHCPHCRIRVKVDADGSTPWHTVGIFVCAGVGQQATDLPKTEEIGKKKRGKS